MARRPTLIVDVEHGRMTPPWTMDEIIAMRGAAVPHAVAVGMWIAAWARAEHCPLNIVGGVLEPHCRYTPSDALYAALGAAMANVVGVLGFGAPLLLHHETRRPFAASWPYQFQHGRS